MNDKHFGPHCAGSCEGAAYQIEIRKLRAENEALREVLEAAIEWDGYDDGGVPAVWLDQARQALASHDLYATGDENAPNSIKDQNGDVALGMCKRCGRAESELSEPCHKAEQSQPVPEVDAMADALGAALRSKHAVFLSRTKLVDLVRDMLAAAPKPGANDE